MKTLVIEDEKKVARFLKLGLEGEGHTVDTAYDGETGEKFALTGKYDVIVLDLMLPKKSGIEVLKSIRSKGISTPVLILTAKGSLEDKVDGLDKGGDDYLVKPFAFAEFMARVRSLGRRRSIEKATVLKIADLGPRHHYPEGEARRKRDRAYEPGICSPRIFRSQRQSSSHAHRYF